MAKVQRIWLQMTYRCCGMEWTDEWPVALRLECPECGEIVAPFEVAEIGPRQTSSAAVRTAAE